MFGEERCKFFLKNLHWLQIKGWEKVKWRQFCDRCTVCKEEVFITTFDWLQTTVLGVHASAGCSGLEVG